MGMIGWFWLFSIPIRNRQTDLSVAKRIISACNLYLEAESRTSESTDRTFSLFHWDDAFPLCPTVADTGFQSSRPMLMCRIIYLANCMHLQPLLYSSVGFFYRIMEDMR